MNRTQHIAAVACIAFPSIVVAAQLPQDCGAQNLNQVEMNSCADASYQNADNQLNEVYRLVLRQYADDLVFIEKLKKSQRLWLRFRDAELELKYPHAEEQGYYGTVYPQCLSGEKEVLTRDRIATLHRWLDGAPEGETCSGSIRLAPPVTQ